MAADTVGSCGSRALNNAALGAAMGGAMGEWKNATIMNVGTQEALARERAMQGRGRGD